jgi:rod shape determining protein RodA
MRNHARVRVEWLLPLIALALALIGALLVWSATRAELQRSGGNPQSYLYRHLFNVGIGIVLFSLAARMDMRLLRLIGPVLYVLSLLGLLSVFVIGSTINGAHAWIVIGGGFEVQPAEFMKLGLIAGMAVMFTHRAIARGNEDRPSNLDVLIALALAGVPLALIMLQPDVGSAIVLCAAAFGVLVAAGVRARWLIAMLLGGALLVVFAVKSGVVASYQLDRLGAFVNPKHDTQGAAYNITQAHIAIANGHLFGTGLFHGPQTNGSFVPEQQTDFVFSVAGEELGFAGSGVIIALFGLLCWRGLRIASAARGSGRLIACGIVCWFAFQAFQNIGMNLGLTPVTGLPLPFVSYGGSSLFAQSLAIGLLIAVGRHSRAEAGRPQ